MRKLAFILALIMAVIASPARAAEEPISIMPISEKIDVASDVGVQLFMWNWKSIGLECKTQLGPAGFDWALVMPPQEHVLGTAWWTHFQPVSYKIESRLGTRAEFAQMVSDCKTAGVEIIVDAVINHMVGGSSGKGWAGSEYAKYYHPGLYEDADFHQIKTNIKSWNDVDEVQNAELLGLSDLATEKPAVRAKIASYLNDLISLGVSGFRIDAARHIPVADIKAIKALLTSDAYIIQEVANRLNPKIEDYFETGDVFEFSWAQQMQEYFLVPGQASGLASRFVKEALLDSAKSVTMVSNHDTERDGSALNLDDAKAQELAEIYTLSRKFGKPMVYSSFVFATTDDAPRVNPYAQIENATCISGSAVARSSYKVDQWACQHRWTSVKGMLAWRDTVGNAAETDVRGSRGVLSYGRSNLGHVIFNSNAKLTAVKVKTRLPGGYYCDLVTGGRSPKISSTKCVGKSIKVDSQGYVSTSMTSRTALAISKDTKQR